MKRGRRPFTARPLLQLQARLYGGTVIPPLTVVVANEKCVEMFGDEQYRIGYYSVNDGLDCVWLVNQKGEYEQTVDQRFLRRKFTVIKLSSETDLYGRSRPAIQPIASA